jgi:signal peptidase II
VFVGAGLVLLLDQITKLAVRRCLLPGESFPIIRGIFHLSYVQNPGAAFGILKYQTGLFIGITALVVAAIIFYAPRVDQGLLSLALSLELGGALGNLIDRLRFGYVVDFLDFRIWPVFNVADMAIVIGVGLIFLYLLRTEGHVA